MAKPRKIDDILATLNSIRDNPTSEEGVATLRQVLNCKHSIAVAAAAKIVGAHEIRDLVPELLAAFDRFMQDGSKTDPGCRAKTELLNALYRMEYSDEQPFLQGIRYIQQEPVWGGQTDTAPPLRCTAALGLVRANYRDVMVELADLLADSQLEARIGAARAIAYSGNPAGVPLLRLRVHVGDEPAVLGECLTALLHLAPQSSLPIAKTLLYSGISLVADPTIAEAAALALGESRLPEAIALLKDWWPQVRNPELRQSGLTAIALSRHDDAIDFLLKVLAEGKTTDGISAIAALSIYCQNETLWQQVKVTVDQRKDALLKRAFEQV